MQELRGQMKYHASLSQGLILGRHVWQTSSAPCTTLVTAIALLSVLVSGLGPDNGTNVMYKIEWFEGHVR